MELLISVNMYICVYSLVLVVHKSQVPGIFNRKIHEIGDLKQILVFKINLKLKVQYV